MRPPQPIPVGMEPPPMDSPRPTPSVRSPDQGTPPKGTARSAAAGRFGVLNCFVDTTMADLTRGELAVWLAVFRDSRDGTARTSYDDLARRTGLNRRNVGRALRGLERRGLLQIVRRGGLRRGPSVYRVRGVAKDG